MTIPVFYSISDGFTKYAAVSLNSLVKNSNPENDSYWLTNIQILFA